jgi:S1-C subfamily serine protease
MQKRQLKALVLSLLIALVAVLFYVPLYAQEEDQPILSEANFQRVYAEASPSVVSINVLAFRQNQRGTNEPVGGSGSGFLIDDSEGYVVTNNHVIDGATRIEVSFIDGTQALAEILGADPDSDIAVLQVDVVPEGVEGLEFADSDTLAVGEAVLAIGSPFGERWTLTSGIISALNRRISGAEQYAIGGVIQTDAAINPGNSGGPLLNLNGQVVGVNTQIRTATGASVGIGFAVPANLTMRVAKDLIENGSVQYSYIGIGGGDVTLSLIQAFDLPRNFQGVVVGNVAQGGPAASAGLRSAGNVTQLDGIPVPGTVDIITAVDGQPMRSFNDLITHLAQRTSPGDVVTLTVLRDGQDILTIDVELGARGQV